MPCYHPLTGYFSKDVSSTGKRGIVFDRNASHSGIGFKLPCGRCIGCRLERARQWAVRCVHESKLHEHNCFLTLTYAPEHLPDDGSLRKRDLQLFMKRLRKRFGNGIRFYGCGEYGEDFGRPHYHILLFNCQFRDKVFYKKSKSGETLYTSDIVRELWPYGHNSIGDVTFDSAAYVAGYVVDKINGEKADEHYYNPDNGVFMQPEFSLMSRRPGIGTGFYERFAREIYRSDSVVLNGAEFPPPRFYDNKFELVDSKRLDKLKSIRRRRAILNKADNTPARRRVREVVAIRKLRMFRREI